MHISVYWMHCQCLMHDVYCFIGAANTRKDYDDDSGTSDHFLPVSVNRILEVLAVFTNIVL